MNAYTRAAERQQASFSRSRARQETSELSGLGRLLSAPAPVSGVVEAPRPPIPVTFRKRRRADRASVQFEEMGPLIERVQQYRDKPYYSKLVGRLTEGAGPSVALFIRSTCGVANEQHQPT